jgi:molecular chaperone DnaJ
MARDYYEILGVQKNADASTIKKAYRQLAMKFHPDRNPGDKASEDKFKEAAEAYDVLSDETKRRKYDQFGHAAFGQGGFGGGQGFHDMNDIFSAFGDIFGDIFGGQGGPGQQRGGRSRSRVQRGSDLRYLLDIELADVLTGTKKEIQFETEESCKTCEGSGAKAGSKPETCYTCKGQGQVVRQQGFFAMATTCGTCRGTGQTIKDPCNTCKGRGRTEVKKKLSISVPAGVDTGTQLRLTGEGEAGTFGGPPGDLYVQINVRADKRFEREGQAIHSVLNLSYLKALLGAKVMVEGLDGEVEVEVEPGVKAGDTIKVREKGLPSLKQQRRGDFVLHVEVDMPKKLTRREEELLREIAKEKGEEVLPAAGFFGRRKN